MKNAVFALTLSLLAAAAGPARAQGQTWLINELSTGVGMVELINVSNASADPSGICLWAREIFGNPCGVPGLPPLLHIRIPTGTAMVPPGGTLLLESRPSPAHPCGLAMTRATSWSNRSELVAWINRDPNDWSRQILDMVSLGDTNTILQSQGFFNPGGAHWSGGPVMRPGTGSCVVLFRPRMPPAGLPVDTDTAADWQVGPYGLDTPCAPNPGGTPNPMTIGEGFSVSGSCASAAFTNTTTELPTLTLADCSFNPRPGGSLQFAVRTGMTSAPPLTCLLFGATMTPGAPLPLASCAGNLVTYVDPVTAGSLCYVTLPWDSHLAADLPVIAIPSSPGLIGLALGFQAYMFDPGAGACPLRNTNGMRIEIKP